MHSTAVAFPDNTSKGPSTNNTGSKPSPWPHTTLLCTLCLCVDGRAYAEADRLVQSPGGLVVPLKADQSRPMPYVRRGLPYVGKTLLLHEEDKLVDPAHQEGLTVGPDNRTRRSPSPPFGGSSKSVMSNAWRASSNRASSVGASSSKPTSAVRSSIRIIASRTEAGSQPTHGAFPELSHTSWFPAPPSNGLAWCLAILLQCVRSCARLPHSLAAVSSGIWHPRQDAR
jgi:hypothetical protein